ncbi:hypothetical protein NEUTE1DRAFT_46427 [Neurospora tetrasperma FGSC 2508]|uniref:Uncharacterized protein n=1 Tax=Neurospora tetrasperma (strain FGSC 2508 / ATCC MYA-4615 / P0657) TaxID=510951 RepID=F8MT68_NEUT8|nr:uncharacterized protein NEUTE1DRAFT_46427 [Neurospora tetrasperma FGSC 2508]EGO55200.1 hypothetical protein NEUTE1DRAFT_46427 [Neurospora tetrasperma FGSC 2508]EGZ69582.1 hypothetical protein NEUTE2DRAFT_70162 [Neurospora tetrasperma FGSC 2509]
MGLEDFVEEVADAVDGQDAAEQASADKTGDDANEDVVVDSIVDEVAEKEDIPAALLPEINDAVNDEFNKL